MPRMEIMTTMMVMIWDLEMRRRREERRKSEVWTAKRMTCKWAIDMRGNQCSLVSSSDRLCASIFPDAGDAMCVRVCVCVCYAALVACLLLSCCKQMFLKS